MKKFSAFSYVLRFIVLICATSVVCETTMAAYPRDLGKEASKASGRLIIRRSPNLAETLLIWVDGEKAAQVRRGQTYAEALSPGQHTVSILLMPTGLMVRPSQKRLTIEKGKTYTFTAAWDGSVVVLR